MNEELLRKIQLIEIDALRELKKICDDNDITFFLRGGSVLGAVKYNGFIPWDDDIDIAVPREDYEKIINLFENRVIANKYVINSYRFCEDLHCYFPRMVLLEEERIRLGLPTNTNLGMHIMDIFPLDGAPNNLFMRMFYYIKIYVYRALASIGTIYEGNMVNMHTHKQQFVINILRLLHVDRFVKQRDIYEILERFYAKYNWKYQKYAGTPTASLITREVMPKQIWGNGKKTKFEGIEIIIPELYDKYLKKLYGSNYLTYQPPVESRKSHF